MQFPEDIPYFVENRDFAAFSTAALNVECIDGIDREGANAVRVHEKKEFFIDREEPPVAPDLEARRPVT